jgi:hypothetical protein
MDGLRLRREAIFFVTSTFASWISFRTRIREIGNLPSRFGVAKPTLSLPDACPTSGTL